MICSWLDHNTGIGNFFIDQALMLSDDFNFILVSFRPVKAKFKNFKELHKIEKHIYEDKITILYISYPVFRVFKKERFKSFFEKKTVKVISKYLKSFNLKIDLIHAQSVFNAAFWAYIFYENRNIPYLITEHNQFTLRNSSSKDIRKLDEILNKSITNLVVSNDLIRQFASNGFFQKFITIGNPVNDTVFNFSDKLAKSNFEIITIGAYTPVKDQLTLLRALKILDNILNERIKFTWIGINSWGADFETEVLNLIDEFEFNNIDVEIVKKASKLEIATALKKSNLFVTTSLCETFGISATEALATGIPVIATQCGGVNEFINEENGVILPIKDPEAIANNILKIMKGELQFNGKLISERISNKFGINSFKVKMGVLYNEAIKN